MPKTETLADLFLEHWKTLQKDEATFQRAIDWQDDHTRETLDWASELDEILAKSDGSVPAELAQWRLEGSGKLRPPNDVQRILLIAQAIDRWHQPLSAPLSPPFSHARAAHQLKRANRLNTGDSDQRVILRRPMWGRYSDPDVEIPKDGRGPWDTFSTLFVIPLHIEASDPDDRSTKRTIAFAYQLFDATELRLPASHDDWKPKVGFVPLAQQADELTFDLSHDHQGLWYDTNVEDLAGRAATAIEKLCAAGAEIIIFPEMVIHPNAVEAIQRTVATYGPPSSLRLVIAGTWRSPNGTAKPFNEAIVLNHRGMEIGRQRKLHRWNLDGALCSRYDVQLPIVLPSGAHVREFITPGEEVLVLDSPFGRLAVMICEDLGRSEPGLWLRDNMLLDWLFTPILDSSIEDGRWMVTSARDAARLQRCRVVVANSVPLTHRQNVVNQASGARPKLSHCGIGICLDNEAGSARYRLEKHSLSDPSDAHYLVEWQPDRWEDFKP